MEFFVFVGIWALIVSLAPFGIWALKSRVSDLERKVEKLEIELRYAKPPAQVQSTQVTPIPQPQPVKPAATPAAAFVESITKRKEILPSAQVIQSEPMPSLSEFVAAPTVARETPPPIPANETVAEPIEQETRSYASRTTDSRMYEPSEPALPSWLTGAFTAAGYL